MNRLTWTASQIIDRLEQIQYDLDGLANGTRTTVSAAGETAVLDSMAISHAIEAVRTLAAVKGML